MAIKMRKQTVVIGLRFPTEIVYNGRTYYRTGKNGTHRATLRPTMEYQLADDNSRLWVFSDGSIATVAA